MGLFSNNYAKPGPGVRKEETESESAVALYFLIFKRRLSKFMQLNLLYALFGIICGFLMVVLFFLPVTRFVMQMEFSGFLYEVRLWELYIVPLPIALFSPIWGGGMVVARRLANREYVFVLSEFKKGVKDNWKQFFGNGIIVYTLYVLFTFSLMYYYTNSSDSIFHLIIFFILIIFATLFALTQLYVPLLIVSVDLKLKHIYKNALILGVLGLPKNILMAILIAAYVAFFGYFMWMYGILIILGAVLILFFSFSFFAYSNAYFCYPVLKKYIIAPYYQKDEPAEEQEKIEEVDIYDNGLELSSEEEEQIFAD